MIFVFQTRDLRIQRKFRFRLPDEPSFHELDLKRAFYDHKMDRLILEFECRYQLTIKVIAIEGVKVPKVSPLHQIESNLKWENLFETSNENSPILAKSSLNRIMRSFSMTKDHYWIPIDTECSEFLLIERRQEIENSDWGNDPKKDKPIWKH